MEDGDHLPRCSSLEASLVVDIEFLGLRNSKCPQCIMGNDKGSLTFPRWRRADVVDHSLLVLFTSQFSILKPAQKSSYRQIEGIQRICFIELPVSFQQRGSILHVCHKWKLTDQPGCRKLSWIKKSLFSICLNLKRTNCCRSLRLHFELHELSSTYL